jgi:hypothetical protein
MIDFVLSQLSGEDLETASKIQPLPASVLPSQEFLNRLRAQIEQVTAGNGAETRAA